MADHSGVPNEEVFIRARFAGGRFDAHTMPLEVLPDLASYRRLIVEVAKHLFRVTHGNRVRVPKGFEQSFGIALARVEGGHSATADLVRIEQSANQYQSSFAPKFPQFEEARDLVMEIIRRVSQGDAVPGRFPPNLVGLFNPFGQSLRPDEFIDISAPNHESVRYSDSVRRSIVLSAEKTYEKTIDDEFMLNGGVRDTSTIHVRDSAGRSLDFQAATEFEFEEAYRRAGGRARLVGSGMFDVDDTLRRLLSVKVYFDVPAFHLEIRRVFEEARALASGDESQARNLERLEGLLVENSDPGLEIGAPFVYVLEDGEISVEWSYRSWESNIEFHPSGSIFRFHALHTVSGRSFWMKVDRNEMASLPEAFKKFFLALSTDDGAEEGKDGEA